MKKKIYIAGKITGDSEYRKKFYDIEKKLRNMGYSVLNPAILPEGFNQEEYLYICFAMIDVCEFVFMLNDWKQSKGATAEHEYAKSSGKEIIYQW